MKDSNFKKTYNRTIGVELELLLVDSNSLLPAKNTDDFFNQIPVSKQNNLKPEFFSQMLEIVSPIFNSVDEIKPFYKNLLNSLKPVCNKTNIELFAMGTHPLLFQKDVSTTDNSRYESLHYELQEILNRFLIMGLHIHVAVKNEDHLINIFNMVNYYLPVFLSLSASSPFFEGKNTGLQSYRSIVFESLPRGGVPEYIESYDDFNKLIKSFYKTKVISSYNDIWWDVRPRPDLGTLELRVCDSVCDLGRIEAITALLQSLCLLSEDKKQKYFFHQMVKQNKWSAVRYDFYGKFIDYDNIYMIKDISMELLKKLKAEGCFTELGTENYIEKIEYYINTKALSKQIVEIYNQTNDFNEILKLGALR